MSMVITCESCESRFRFDEGLLKGAKGALVKCPRCSERILVRNPAAPRVIPPVAPCSTPRGTLLIVPRISPPVGPPVEPPLAPPLEQLLSPPVAPPVEPPLEPPAEPPVASLKLPLPALPNAVDTIISPIREEAEGEKILPVPRKQYATGADLSAMIRHDPVHTPPDEITFSPAAAPRPLSPEIPGKQAQRVADLFRSPLDGETDRNLSGDDDSSMEDREAGPALRLPPIRPLYRRPLFVAAVISLLLLAGGAFYYVDGNPGRKPSGSVFPVQGQSAPGHPVFDVRNLKGNLNKLATGEGLYVIKGTVTNVGKTVSSGIRIQASLLGKDNQTIMQNETFAGNLIDESLLSHMSRVRIEGFLGIRYGEGNANRDIPVGMSLPFMVVFFDPPEGIQSFTVKAMDVEEAERIQSSGSEKTEPRVFTQQSNRLN